MRLTYDEYKSLERQMEQVRELETTHTSTPGPFYHKSIRLHIGELTIEFHGPTVMGDDDTPQGKTQYFTTPVYHPILIDK